MLLENSGPKFRSSERFIGAIRQYLCLSLLKNAASSIPAALQLSASIFLSLLQHFRCVGGVVSAVLNTVFALQHEPAALQLSALMRLSLPQNFRWAAAVCTAAHVREGTALTWMQPTDKLSLVETAWRHSSPLITY